MGQWVRRGGVVRPGKCKKKKKKKKKKKMIDRALHIYWDSIIHFS